MRKIRDDLRKPLPQFYIIYIMRNFGRLRRAAGMLRAFLRSLMHGTQECHVNA